MRNLETVLSFRCGCKVYTAHALYVASEDWIMAQISVLRIFFFFFFTLGGVVWLAAFAQHVKIKAYFWLVKMKTVAKRTI